MNLLSPAIAITCLGLLLSPDPLPAAPLNLYQASVPVADQSPGERARAMPPALAQVLQKLTGLRDFSGYPDLDQVLEKAHSIAIAFYYRNRQVTLQDGSAQQELRLQVEFSRPAVKELLQALPLPIWNPDRRPLTVWLVIDDGLERRIMPIDYEYVWESVAETAQTRGLTVVRPQPDTAGVYAVDPQLLWGGYTEELAGSGQADALVIAALRDGQEWTVRLNLDYLGKRWSWRLVDTNLQNALTEAMNQAIDDISSANSVAPADQGQWTFEITVTGLRSGADYVRCLTYLQGVSLVEWVRVTEAGQGSVQFDLGLNAVPDYLLRALASGGVLAPTGTAARYSLLQ